MHRPQLCAAARGASGDSYKQRGLVREGQGKRSQLVLCWPWCCVLRKRMFRVELSVLGRGELRMTMASLRGTVWPRRADKVAVCGRPKLDFLIRKPHERPLNPEVWKEKDGALSVRVKRLSGCCSCTAGQLCGAVWVSAEAAHRSLISVRTSPQGEACPDAGGILVLYCNILLLNLGYFIFNVG